MFKRWARAWPPHASPPLRAAPVGPIVRRERRLSARARGCRFSEEENVRGTTQVKTSVRRAIRKGVLAECPGLADAFDNVMFKKDDAMFITKW